MSAGQVTIEVVTDLDAAWDDLARLFQGVVAYHEPLTGERLQPGWEAAWRTHLEQPQTLLLLARDAEGRAIGFARASQSHNPALGIALGMVDTVYIEEAWRRRGIGRRFVREIEAWCRDHGLSRLDLFVRAMNLDGIAAWRAMGFADESLRLKKQLD